MITEKRVIEIATDYAVNPLSIDALHKFAMKVFRIGVEHQRHKTWIKPSDHLPMHQQDVIVCRLIDGKARIDQSMYFKGENIKGFFDLEDGEAFYDDDAIRYWMPVEMESICRELEKESDCE